MTPQQAALEALNELRNDFTHENASLFMELHWQTISAALKQPDVSGLVKALVEMTTAINDGVIDSHEVGGEPEVCGHTHKWHEEWLYHAQKALAHHASGSKGEV